MKDAKQPGVVTLAILTALTCILWVFFSVISVLSDEPVSTVSPEILESIDPSLDLETLNKIRDGLVFDENNTQSIEVVVTDTTNQEDEASESANIEDQNPEVDSTVDPNTLDENLQGE